MPTIRNTTLSFLPVRKKKQAFIKDKRYKSKAWVDYSYSLRCKVSKCQITNQVLPYHKLVVDHVIPVNAGGSFWDKRNHQVISCVEHNKKSAREKHNILTPYVLNENNEKIPLINSI